MGQKLTLSMNGKLRLSVDGSPSRLPLTVDIEDFVLDLDTLMQQGLLTMTPDRPDRVQVTLRGVEMTLTLDSRDVLSRGGAAIVAGLEGN